MISQLNGTIISKQPPFIVIDVHGVGYEVAVSMNTLAKLPENGSKVILLTQFIVREDAQLLYGFHDEAERSLFKTLIKVNGVGPKLALTILSSIEPNRFAECVAHNDSASLVKLPGVGKKTAERLLVEMRGKLDIVSSNLSATIVVQKSASSEAISALVSLGYKPQEASRAVNAVAKEEQACEIIIRDALKYLAA